MLHAASRTLRMFCPCPSDSTCCQRADTSSGSIYVLPYTGSYSVFMSGATVRELHGDTVTSGVSHATLSSVNPACRAWFHREKFSNIEVSQSDSCADRFKERASLQLIETHATAFSHEQKQQRMQWLCGPVEMVHYVVELLDSNDRLQRLVFWKGLVTRLIALRRRRTFLALMSLMFPSLEMYASTTRSPSKIITYQ